MKALIALHHRISSWNGPQWFGEQLRRDFPQLSIVQLPDFSRVQQEIADAELAVAWTLHPDQIAAAKKLRWIHSGLAAVNALMTPELVASDVVVTNARAVHGPVVAEHALALAFAMAKRLPQAAAYQREKHWATSEITTGEAPPRELRDATMTIVGMGSIGSTLAGLAKAVGMRVVGVREHPERMMNGVDAMYGFDDLNGALSEGDFVVLGVPVTPRTTALMNAERLACLKRNAYLINVGRGVLIDEAALIDALRAKRFAGAALDVTAQEPLPPESPLWQTEGVFITPHYAGFSQRMWERQYALYSDNLRRYLNGEPLLWTVDKKRGY